MRSFIKYLSAITLLFMSAAIPARAQDAHLRFESLSQLESKARDVVEVNIDGKLLDLAKSVMVKVNDPEAKRSAQAISGLKGIYVRVYTFANENEYDMADIDEIRASSSHRAGSAWPMCAARRTTRRSTYSRCSLATR